MIDAGSAIASQLLSALFVVVFCLVLPVWLCHTIVRRMQGKRSPGMLWFDVPLGLFLALLLVSAFIGVQVSRLIIVRGPSALVLIVLGVVSGLWLR